MLLHLHIENYALIQELSIEFAKGLNILTGETGAGKSIIIGAMNLVLGERADRELIRAGSETAAVQALFDCKDKQNIKDMLDEQGIPMEEDGTVLLARNLNRNGKNTCYINGTMVTLSVMKEAGGYLVDVHGQHEHQSLLRRETHKGVIDALGDAAFMAQKERVREAYDRWHALCSEVRRLEGIGPEGERKKDIYSYQIDEIKKAKLTPGEEEELRAELTILQNAEKIALHIEEAYGTLTGSGDSGAVMDGVGGMMQEMNQVRQYGEALDEIAADVENVYYQLEGLSDRIRDCRDTMEFDRGRQEEIEERLMLLNGLKRKYGGSVKEVLEFYQKICDEYDDLIHNEEKLGKVREEESAAKRIYREAAQALSRMRKDIADGLADNILAQLKQLGMEKTRFAVANPAWEGGDIESLHWGLEGYDDIEFMISTNPGERMYPLAKIVSGGEMSRLMLAFKTILAETDAIPVLIFDEIDTGISGRMAQAVAEKMADTARYHQVICITHLPQISAMADRHYLVKKQMEQGRTVTSVDALREEDSIEEMARMLGGRQVTEISIKNAGELRKLALIYKEKAG